MGGTCGRSGGKWECIQGFGWEKLKYDDHTDDPGIDRTIILKWILKT